MKWYHLGLLFLKIAFVIQFIFILGGKGSVHSKAYLTTEILFKVLLSFYIEYLLFFTHIEGLLFEDKLVIGFASGLLFYDAMVNDIPKLLKLYNIKIPLLN
jgi:hypothetical protein